MDDSNLIWIEIKEPSSSRIMYVNLVSGETSWKPPDCKFKPCHEDQWWELYDSRTDKNYYFNSSLNKTVWNRPSNADIVPFTKIQFEQQSRNTEQSKTAAIHSIDSSEPSIGEKERKPARKAPSVPFRSSPKNTPLINNGLSSHQLPTQKNTNSPYDTHNLEASNEDRVKSSRSMSESLPPHTPLLSPLASQNNHMFYQDTPTGEFQTQHLNHTASTHFTDSYPSPTKTSVSKIYSPTHCAFSQSYNVEQDVPPANEHSNDTVVQCEAVDLTDSSHVPIFDHLTDRQDSFSLAPNSNKSEHLVNASYDDSFNLTSTNSIEVTEDYTACAQTLDPRKLTRDSDNISSQNMNYPPTYPTLYQTAKPLHLTPPDDSDRRLTKSTSMNIPPIDKDASKRCSVSSMMPLSRGVLVRPTEYGETVTRLEEFREFNQHKQGFIFRKKISLADMLAWTKDPIKQPMIRTSNKIIKKEAIELFKLVQQYMGDRRIMGRSEKDAVLLEISRKTWATPEVRDELYVQLCRQTTSNNRPESIRRGWELFCVALAFFPPSNKFANYLEGYLWNHVEPSCDKFGVEVSAYGKLCYRLLEKMRTKGAKRGLKKPSLDEVIHARAAPFNPTMFGVSLEDIMDLQSEKSPSLKVPWIMKSLFEIILKLKGTSQEGIFRVPGDIDEVNNLKMLYDKWQEPSSLTDANIPSSLLKLWFRELETPLIPEDFYKACVNNSENENQCLSLVHSLPPLNRTVFFSLIRFLQYFSAEDSARYTKMNLENLSMVWAPNCLRCPSEDPMMIFENTRKEMSFLRNLINSLDTSSVQDII